MENFLSNLKTLVQQVSNPFKQEIIILATLFIGFIAPLQGLFYITGIAVFIDTVYAIYATIKLKGVIYITSHKLFNITIKTFFYLTTILTAYMVSIYIVEGELFDIKLFLPKVLCTFWLIIESKSIDETNIKLGNKSFLETIKNIIKWLKEFKKDVNELT